MAKKEMTRNERFDILRDPSALSITFSSTLENIDRADQETHRFLEENGAAHHSFATRLVLREGLTNAVVHAHKKDPSKVVKYELKLDGGALVMEIEDQGEGFDWESAGRKQHDVTDDHGRGMAIMTHYFTEFRYNPAGTKLTLVKKLED